MILLLIGFSSWSDCSRSCGPDAYQLRVRQCTQMGEECILQKETEEEIKYCEIKSCEYAISVTKFRLTNCSHDSPHRHGVGRVSRNAFHTRVF